jgi:hypothetical protein
MEDLGTIQYTETKLTLVSPDGKKEIYTTKKNPTYEVGTMFIKFKGITFFLFKTIG